MCLRIVLAVLLGLSALSAETRVSIVHHVVSVTQVPLWIAHEQGLFAKHGIDAQVLLADEPARSITGETPFGVIGIPAAIGAMAGGKDVKVLVVLGSARTDSQLVVRPDIKTPSDLRGKRFGVTRIGGGSWISSMLALEHLGLDPKHPRISLVEVRDLPRMAHALEVGEIDAAMVDPAQSTQLKAKGLSVLLDLYPANISGVQNALVVAGAYLRGHPDVVERVVAALVEGIGFSLSPRNKEPAVKTLMAHMKISAPAAAERGYQSIIARLNRKPYASVAAMKNMQRVMALHNPNVLRVKVEDIVEDRFVRMLDESGEIDRLYSSYGANDAPTPHW